MSESKHTRTPWEIEPDGHDYIIHGDRQEIHPEDDEEDGPESGSSEYSHSVVTVGRVLGNRTSGDIPRLNAEMIVRAVNCHGDLLAACQELTEALWNSGGSVDVYNRGLAAIAKANGEELVAR